MHLSGAALPSDAGKVSPQVWGQLCGAPKRKQHLNQHQQHTSKVMGEVSHIHGWRGSSRLTVYFDANAQLSTPSLASLANHHEIDRTLVQALAKLSGGTMMVGRQRKAQQAGQSKQHLI